MSSNVDLELNASMNASKEHFFASLKGGSDSTTSFLQRWSALNDTFQSHLGHLKEETITNAHNLATTIGIIASRMLELDRYRDLMDRQLAKDFALLLNNDMENLVIRDEFPILTNNGSTPSYIKPCSQWLLANLHSPYPPKSVRNSICRQTGTPIKDLDAWFTDARKRIGWNQLRRTHFSNRREKIIDAATSFFKPSKEFLKLDPFPQAFPLDRSDDHSMAFVEMEERAQRLFSDKFEVTPLARSLDNVIQDSPPLSQMRDQPNQTESQNQHSDAILKRKRNAYPSPQRSPQRSPEPLTPSVITIPSPPPLSTASHKRCHSSSEAFVDDIDPNRPQKRFRPTHARELDSALAASSLPSPAASLNEVSSPVGADLMLPSSASSPALPDPTLVHAPAPLQLIPSTKRKRRFSDSEDQRPTKYLQPTPLSHITSDSFPIANDLLRKSSVEDLLQDYLLNQSFSYDIPPSTLNEVLDDSTPVDVDYYQYSLSPVVLDNGLQPEFTLRDFSMSTSAPLQETIGLSPSFELNTWAGGLQGYSLQDFLNAEDSMCTTELDPLLPGSNYFQFSEARALDEPSIPTSHAFDWMTFVNQPINILSASNVETGAVLTQPSLVPTLGQQSTAMELAAKRELAELLRAQLQRLEADIA